MINKNVLGIVFSSAYDDNIREMTNIRTMGSIPFAGRYRLIDFVLSNMVNCGITKVGVVTKSNYQSLMDHVSSGKPWDLSRKNEGLFLLPPFSNFNTGYYHGRIEALLGISSFLENSKEEYVLLSDCNAIYNIDFNEILRAHDEKDADITIVYKNGKTPALRDLMSFRFADDGRITEASILDGEQTTADYSINIMLMRKSLLQRLMSDAHNMNYTSFERDIIQKNVSKLKMYGYEAKGFAEIIDSLQSYYDINMSLLDIKNNDSLFDRNHPIYTKIRDDMPVIYGLGSDVKNSIVADGCVIDGTVENSILFRGVRVAKGAVVKNSIVMQDSYISEDAKLDCVITDKGVVVKPAKVLTGDRNYPFFIGKGIVI